MQISSKNYINKMLDDGVFVFKKMIKEIDLQELTTEVQKINLIVSSKISNMERPLKTYSDIAERHLGRLDYRCGFFSPIFSKIGLPIIKIINDISPKITFKHYWGAIPSQGKSGPTNMHRDVYPILNTSHGNNLDKFDISLPPYYFTVLIPLVEITKENGPTEFIKGSHLKQISDENNQETYAPLLTPGDLVIFDGRTLHRGLANNTSEERMIAYITFVANWYNDQTFVQNDFLFPELIRTD